MPLPESQKRYSDIQAEVSLQFGSVRLVHDRFAEPVDFSTTQRETHVVTLTLVPVIGDAIASYASSGPTPIGQVFLLPAYHPVRIVSECQQQSSIICNYKPEATQQWLDQQLDWNQSRLQATLDIKNHRIKNLLSSLAHELQFPGFASQSMIELMAGQIAIEVSRHFGRMDAEKASGGLAPWMLTTIEERLRASTSTSTSTPTVAELATLCNLSVRHLSRAFRASKEQSIGSYIREYRIETAKRLLEQGSCIKAVAYELGFSAPSNFITAFRKATGKTPKAYQVELNRVFTFHPLL